MMGVDLAIYRARIGTFIRRNVSNGDDQRTVKSKSKLIINKPSRTTNLITMELSLFSHSWRISMYSIRSIKFGYLQPEIPHVRVSIWL